MAISNKYINIFKGFINSLDIKLLIIPKQINILNNKILSIEDKTNNLKIDKIFK